MKKFMKKIILLYNKIMSWAKGHFILKYFINRELIAELWYKTWVYKILAAPAIVIKRRNIYSNAPIKAFTMGITLAMLGLIPPLFWRDWFVFGLFFLLSVIFIFIVPNVRVAANYSIFLYIFVLVALLLPPNSLPVLIFLSLIAMFGISFLIMNLINEFGDVYKILCGIYIAVVARAIYMPLDTILFGVLQSENDFSEFLIMLFPLALTFAFLKQNKGWRWYFVAGLLPSLYGVAAILFNIGNSLERQISEIPTDGNLIDIAFYAQGIFARGGTIGTQPFLNIYNAAMASFNSQDLLVRLLIYVGMFAVLLFLWFVIRLIRRAVVQLFRQKGNIRIILLAGVIALLGVIIIVPFEIERLSMQTIFIYWIVIGIVGGIVKMTDKR